MDLFLTDKGDVFVVRDITATHGTEMGRFKLAVDHEASEDIEHTGQMDEGKFRGTGNQREHTLSEEAPAKVDTIEAAYQAVAFFLFLPHLDTRRKALTMEFGIGLDNVGPEPGAILRIAVLGSGTTLDDTIEILIDGDGIAILLDELLHGVADMDLLGENHETLQGTIPIGFIAVAEREPREETIGIGQQQTVDGEVATHSRQTIVLTIVRIREPEFIV